MPNLRVIITTFLFLLPLSNLAIAMEYEEGTHYVELQIPLNTRNPDKIEVAEYFSYGCPHCYQFEPVSYTHLTLPTIYSV